LLPQGKPTNSSDHSASDRIRVDLIEADVDSAFGLIDDAREEFQEGNVAFMRRALEEVARVLADIESRLSQLDAKDSAPFGLLLEELRKSYQAATDESR
jgi:hypothetical protein